jgi:UTP--glucose-1-phosphate uridylyltransferase
MKIDVAVVPAAGRGTRMRPATRVVPKALIPVVDRPTVQYAVEEAARAGAREVIVVVDPEVGELVHRHFDEEGGLPGLEGVEVRPVVQEVARGLGDAVLVAREAVAGRPFFCLLVDNIVLPGRDVLASTAAASNGSSVVCLRSLGPEMLERYGVVIPGPWRDARVLEVRGAVEKPGREAAPSNLGLVGRYLFTPEIFEALEGLPPGHGGEVQLTDAIRALAEGGRCLGLVIEDDLLDVGTPLGLMEATAYLGADHPEWAKEYRQFLTSFVESL